MRAQPGDVLILWCWDLLEKTANQHW